MAGTHWSGGTCVAAGHLEGTGNGVGGGQIMEAGVRTSLYIFYMDTKMTDPYSFFLHVCV